MKTLLRCLAALLLPAVLLLQACDTSGIASRAQEKATVFDALPPAVQKHIQGGNVELGYTEDMVYIALGKPTRVETKKIGSGVVPVWVYTNMALDTKAGWRGLSYNSDMGGMPGMASNNMTSIAQGGAPSPGRPSAKSATQTNNSVNQDDEDMASQLPDLPMGTLYIFFYQGKVFRLNMKS